MQPRVEGLLWAGVSFQTRCCWGDKTSIWSSFCPVFLSSFLFWHSLFHPVNCQILIGIGLRKYNLWSSSSLTSPQITKNTAVSPWQEKPRRREEMPSPYQRMFHILAEVSLKPWASTRASLGCDTFGWCVLPWSCWTLHQKSHSGTHSIIHRALRERLAVSLYTQDWDQMCVLSK